MKQECNVTIIHYVMKMEESNKWKIDDHKDTIKIVK